MTAPVHATAVARMGPDGWRGLLLRGPSGTGKSELALRLVDLGWRLVADDYANLWASGGALYACAPDRIAGRIEARGLGILDARSLPLARIVLLVDCQRCPPERLPDPLCEEVAGVRLTRLVLDTRPVAATVTLGLAMDRL